MPAQAASSFLFVPSWTPAYRWVPTGKILCVRYILKGKPASMLSYSGKQKLRISSASSPLPVSITQMHLPPDSTCSSPSAWGSHGKSIPASAKQQQLQYCSESNSVYLETQCKVLAGNPARAKQVPSFQATEVRRTLNPLVGCPAPEADTGMVCGKHQVKAASTLLS